jgi:hypothetical protein
MKGWHSLITYTFGNANGRHMDLELIRKPWEQPPERLDPAKKSTLIVSSVYNDRNAWVNGGKLIRRLNNLYDMHDQSGKEGAQTRDTSAYLRDISPAAIRLAKLMLYLIVQDPKQVSIPAQIDPDKGATQYFTQGSQIAIRDDAARVLQHIKPMGYSKGGNIVTDAVRYLITELEQPGVFQLPGLAADASVTERHKVIAKLIHPMGIFCVNPGICPLTAREKSCGMRRLTIRNTYDKITAHLFKRQEGRFGERDDVYKHNGTARKELGHSIPDALGNEDKPGYLTDETGIHNNTPLTEEERNIHQEIKSRLKTYFAACIDAVGISNIHYDAHRANEFEIEFSGGVSSSLVAQRKGAIFEALKTAGFTNARIEDTPLDNGNYRFHVAPSRSDALQGDRTSTIVKLIKAFEDLSTTKDNKVFVSRTTLNNLEKQAEILRQSALA